MNNYDLNSTATLTPATKGEKVARSLEKEFSSSKKLDKAKKKLKKYRKLCKSSKSHKKENRKKIKKYEKKIKKYEEKIQELELRLTEQKYQIQVLGMNAEYERRFYQLFYQLSSGRRIPKSDTYLELPQFTERDDK